MDILRALPYALDDFFGLKAARKGHPPNKVSEPLGGG